MTDLFHRLNIHYRSIDTLGERVDIGWRAWTSCAPKARTGHWQRLRFWLQQGFFWLAVWRFFGKQHVLIQVDDHYLTATGARVFANAEGCITITLMQRTSIIRHCLRYALWHRRNPLHITLKGREVNISHLSKPSVEMPKTLRHCPAALLDNDSALSLPLRITCQAS